MFESRALSHVHGRALDMCAPSPPDEAKEARESGVGRACALRPQLAAACTAHCAPGPRDQCNSRSHFDGGGGNRARASQSPIPVLFRTHGEDAPRDRNRNQTRASASWRAWVCTHLGAPHRLHARTRAQRQQCDASRVTCPLPRAYVCAHGNPGSRNAVAPDCGLCCARASPEGALCAAQ